MADFTAPLQTALETLRAEALALNTLAEHVVQDADFSKALELILSCTGRVIVTGVGKSGHIGGKIAATLASTGTPAFFVHPTEALHGDLGMITQQDIVMALSHSGESKELMPVLTYVTRFDIPLIALTGKPLSSLGKAATAILNNRVEKEACPLGLAPTTSTTATLALADALATALITARGFKKEDFAVFHPGGKLGAQLLHLSDVMKKENLPLLSAETPMRDVLVALTQCNLGCVGLTAEDGSLVGIFTDGDLKRRLTDNLLSLTARDVMTPAPKTISYDVLASTAARQMDAQNVTCLWVLKDHKPVGLVRLADLLHAGVI